MKKINRIKKYQEFREIIDNCNCKKSKNYFIYYRKNDYSYERYGIMVTKKNGIAVIRNKIKRQIRSIIDETVDFKKSFDIVILVSKKYLYTDFKANKDELSVSLLEIRSENEK